MLKTTWKGYCTCQWTGFLGERESEEQVSLVLVVRERRHKMTWAIVDSEKRN